ncbi:MAG: hypothetical protein ACP5N1_01750 [Candidatus Woesearchaeota archaeon]
MQKGFLRLNDEELNWLERKLCTIDVQTGCPWQCIICGVDAPKHSGSMAWSDYIALSDSILDVKSKKNINLKSYEGIDSFWSSDPMYYHSFDGGIERTAYDILNDLLQKHNDSIYITTAGWKSGNNYMQRAAEKIVDMNIKNNFNPLIYYGVKTVSKQILKEYDSFLEKSRSKKVSNSDFIKESRYVSNFIDNARTLKNMEYDYVTYMFYYIHSGDVALLNKEYARYSPIFSREFMKQIYSCARSENLITTSFGSGIFGGIGRALNIGRMSLNNDFKKNNSLVNSDKYLRDTEYSVHVNGLGKIEIYYGYKNSLSKVLVPKEYFNNLVNIFGKNEDKKKYQMLANLQGKELLR